MKINKRIVSVGMIFTFTLTPISQGVLASGIDNPDEIRPYVWAGRPGGNGDGSEEYLNLGYGEMNGPYKVVGTNTGKVSDFNSARDLVENIAFTAIGLGLPDGVLKISTKLAPKILNDHIDGIVYKTTTYVSGRRAKLAIQT